MTKILAALAVVLLTASVGLADCGCGMPVTTVAYGPAPGAVRRGSPRRGRAGSGGLRTGGGLWRAALRPAVGVHARPAGPQHAASHVPLNPRKREHCAH